VSKFVLRFLQCLLGAPSVFYPVHLRAGDVLVQRGTIHNWINRGTAPCVMAFTLIEAKPVDVGGKMLHATG